MSTHLALNQSMFKSKSYRSSRRHVLSQVDKHMDEMEHEIRTHSMYSGYESDTEIMSVNTDEFMSTNCTVSAPLDMDDWLFSDEFDYYRVASSESDTNSSLDDDEISDDDLPRLLADWAISFEIPNNAFGSLLGLLHTYHPSLPVDPRTILHTPRNTVVKQLSDGGSYKHIGIRHNLTCILVGREFEAHVNDECLTVQINIDGLPIFKSSGLQLWPILGILKGTSDSKPFTIGVYAGNKKPGNLSEFLDEFIKEASDLKSSGIEICGHQFRFEIHSFVCDAPARSLLKGTKGHTAYHGCERCTQRGEWKNKMTYPETDAPLRTDLSFKELLDNGHHRHKSPLDILGVGLVTGFCLDYMHLVCLGIVRRLILLWMRGPLPSRLSASMLGQISEHLVQLRCLIPSEFARKPRSLYEIDRWKATELRQFLLYTGPVVLLHVLEDHMYEHFMLLSVGMYCCLNANLCEYYADYAQILFTSFVQQGLKIYGQEFVVYNVHSLIHILDDVRLFGALDNISSFPFENHLRSLKKSIRRPGMPLQQIVRRLTEKEISKCVEVTQNDLVPKKDVIFKKVHDCGPLPIELQGVSQVKQYASLHWRSMTIKICNNDSVFVLDNGSIVKVQNIVSLGEQTLIVYKCFLQKKSFYNIPLPSADIGVFEVSRLSSNCEMTPIGSVVQKLVCLYSKDEKSCICIPLAHNE